jgi:NAD-dependent deacetylase
MPNPELVEHIQNAEHILIFTGAGISTASGIPDFRGPNGVWKTRQPVLYQDFMTSEEVRTEAWDQKLEAWAAFENARPNALHKAIAKLERSDKIECVVTQNIDGLHARAGTSPEPLIELHGTNAEVECQTCGKRSDPERHYAAFRRTKNPPLCECDLAQQKVISWTLNSAPLKRASLAHSWKKKKPPPKTIPSRSMPSPERAAKRATATPP